MFNITIIITIIIVITINMCRAVSRLLAERRFSTWLPYIINGLYDA